jgi:hypothetical protein
VTLSFSIYNIKVENSMVVGIGSAPSQRYPMDHHTIMSSRSHVEHSSQ